MNKLVYSYKPNAKFIALVVFTALITIKFLIPILEKKQGIEYTLLLFVVAILTFSYIFAIVQLIFSIALNHNISIESGVLYIPRKIWSKKCIAIPLVDIIDVSEMSIKFHTTILAIRYNGGEQSIFKYMLSNHENYISLKRVLLDNLHVNLANKPITRPSI